MLDIIAAWALFILLKPVNQHLSLLTGWFRLVYAIIALSALTNLVTVLPILHNTNFAKTFQPGLQNIQIDLSISAFKNGWYFGLIFFGIHLGLLGYLVFRSGYIPKILGILLVISALGYFLNAVRPYLFPSANLDFAKYTFFGELIFMVWLLIRGPMIKEQS